MMMPAPRAARENDVCPDREPEGVIADKGNLNEYPDDREEHQYERKRKSKVHCASPLAMPCMDRMRRVTLSRREALPIPVWLHPLVRHDLTFCRHLGHMDRWGLAVAA
jgi:hypothetical protein